MYLLSKLDQQKLNKLREFEQEKGVKVLAFSEVDAEPADIDQGALDELKHLEEELGVTLVAYE